MRSKSRPGFTLIEIAVAAAILAMLAMVTAPALSGYLDEQRAQTTADQLSDLASGIAAFAQSVKTAAAATSTTYPGFISELTSQIPANSTVWHNSCGNAATEEFNATATAAWSANGPFLTFLVPQGGLETPLGMVSDALVRGNTTPVATTLSIQLVGIDTADATRLDQIIDGGDGANAGTLREGTPAAGLVTVSYLVPVGAHC